MKKGSLSMRKFREILRLDFSGLSQRQIARSLNISVGCVHKYLKLARASSLIWPLGGLDDEALKKRLYQSSSPRKSAKNYTLPDGSWIEKELKHKGVTLRLLHEEYKISYPDTFYGYTKFCEFYTSWRKAHRVSCRQTHKAGDVGYVDYAGPTVPLRDPMTEEICQEASLFVMVLGASQYSYCEATLDKSLPNWIGAHTRAFGYFGGVPALLVPDNLKTGVSKAHPYDPEVQWTYGEMAQYYGCAIMPARPYKPKDKASAESGVLLVERWILARLRHKVFYDLATLNQDIQVLLKGLNNKLFQKRSGSRASHFKEVEFPALKPLPARPYEVAFFKSVKIPPDYHILYEGHYYSVPYTLVGKEVTLRATAHTIEILFKGQRLASHPRRFSPGLSTCPSHGPETHRKHREWSLEKALKWAQELGPATAKMMEYWGQEKSHPQQIYRLFLGMLKLHRGFKASRIEAACRRLLHYDTYSFSALENILEKGLDQEDLTPNSEALNPLEHKNIRGPHYYQQKDPSHVN